MACASSWSESVRRCVMPAPAARPVHSVLSARSPLKAISDAATATMLPLER